MKEKIAEKLEETWFANDSPNMWKEMAKQSLSLIREEIEKELLTDEENVLASSLWRPLHDILIDWNEGRMKIEKSGIRGTLSNMAKGENNIRAVKTMIEVVAQAQLDKVLKALES